MLKDRLRALKSLAGPFPAFDPATVPDDPCDLFTTWLEAAIDAGIREPHAMTLSTVDTEGHPDARVLILKNLDEAGWHFATTRTSPTGQQITANPRAALTFYWQPLGRQVRVSGTVADLGPAVRDADFLARPLGARVAALLARQSDALGSDEELAQALERQQRLAEQEPDKVAPDWVVYAVAPVSVEFWQGDTQRRHIRLRYRRSGTGWRRERLWP
jgi:pyridoxamine 5'-phosphate oxidase